MSEERAHGFSGRRKVYPFFGVLAIIYLIFAASLANTTYLAMQGKTTAVAGLEASTLSMQLQKKAFTDVQRQLEQLQQQVQDMASSNRTSTQLTQHLQQLKLDLSQQLDQVVSRQVTKTLANQAAEFGKLNATLQAHTTLIDRRIPQSPSGPRVADNELHHIATATSVCDKHGASGLTLDLTDDLVAPLVVVGHNRPGYMAKTIIKLMK